MIRLLFISLSFNIVGLGPSLVVILLKILVVFRGHLGVGSSDCGGSLLALGGVNYFGEHIFFWIFLVLFEHLLLFLIKIILVFGDL